MTKKLLPKAPKKPVKTYGESAFDRAERIRDEKLQASYIKRGPGRPLTPNKEDRSVTTISLSLTQSKALDALALKLGKPRVVLIREGIELVLAKKSGKG